MNDPLKKLIDQRRDDFDDLEPSADVLFNIIGELKVDKPKEKITVTRLTLGQKWLSAAAVLILLFSGYLIFFNSHKNIVVKENNMLANGKTNKNIEERGLEKKTKSAENNHLTTEKTVKTNGRLTAVVIPKVQVFNMEAKYKDLRDSTSASARLAAVLAIGQSGLVDYDMVDRLAKTLTADGNNNVRLAVLNLLGQYSHDVYVNSILQKALSTQQDPILQLGLIELLSKTDDPKLDDRLYALANDPNTFTAVKDQAYLVLLNQNKL